MDKEITDEHRTYHDIIYNVGADIKIGIPLFKRAANDIDPYVVGLRADDV